MIDQASLACLQCGVIFVSHRRWPARTCMSCRVARHRGNGQRAASTLVAAARRTGQLQPATDFRCTDCPKPAACYDHRDYSKPLDVQPVCFSCNAKRGPGKWVRYRPIRELLAEARTSISAGIRE